MDNNFTIKNSKVIDFVPAGTFNNITPLYSSKNFLFIMTSNLLTKKGTHLVKADINGNSCGWYTSTAPLLPLNNVSPSVTPETVTHVANISAIHVSDLELNISEGPILTSEMICTK